MQLISYVDTQLNTPSMVRQQLLTTSDDIEVVDVNIANNGQRDSATNPIYASCLAIYNQMAVQPVWLYLTTLLISLPSSSAIASHWSISILVLCCSLLSTKRVVKFEDCTSAHPR